MGGGQTTPPPLVTGCQIHVDVNICAIFLVWVLVCHTLCGHFSSAFKLSFLLFPYFICFSPNFLLCFIFTHHSFFVYYSQGKSQKTYEGITIAKNSNENPKDHTQPLMPGMQIRKPRKCPPWPIPWVLSLFRQALQNPPGHSSAPPRESQQGYNGR